MDDKEKLNKFKINKLICVYSFICLFKYKYKKINNYIYYKCIFFFTATPALKDVLFLCFCVTEPYMYTSASYPSVVCLFVGV